MGFLQKIKDKYNGTSEKNQDSVRHIAEIVTGLTIFSFGLWIIRKVTGN